MNKLEEKQMNKCKKGLSLLVALMLLMSMTMAFTTTAFAAGTSVITINQPDSDTITNDGQLFSAYKVFDLTYADDAFTYTVASSFKAFFNNPPEGLGLTGDMSDPQIAAVISGHSNDGGEMRALGDALAAYINANKEIVLPEKTASGSKTGATTITGLDLGYYLITGSAKINDAETTVVASCSLTSTTPNAEITPKVDVPSIEKKVNGDVTDNGSIGDKVNYTLTAKVPGNLTLYDSYTFTIHDKMGAGLTFNNDVDVRVGSTEFLASGDYTLTTVISPLTDETTITIALNNKKILNHMGETVVVTYSATINEKAIVKGGGNSNEAYLEFSNDPFNTGTGTTVPDITNVYTYEIDIFKYTKVGETDTPLANATFNLQIAGGDDIGVKLMTTGDGTNPSVYRHMNAQEKAGGAISDIIITPLSGKIKIVGLSEGLYTLTETRAPDGYNLLPDSIGVKITASNDNASFNVTYGTDGTGTIDVLNLSGTEFPGTGGIGRTIFTIGGTILMAGALAALYFRRKTDK